MKATKKIAALALAATAMLGATGCQSVEDAVTDAATNAAQSAAESMISKGKNAAGEALGAGKSKGEDDPGSGSSNGASFDSTGYKGDDAATVLASLDTYDGSKASGYSGKRKALFGDWMDLDGNGCDSREDTLLTHMQDVKNLDGNKCKIAAGHMVDPYSGKTLQVTFGPSNYGVKDIQIDHIVSLSNAWDSGAHTWQGDDLRYQIANDPLNLIPTDGALNQDKSDKSFDEWQAPADSGNCLIAAHQIAVKQKYDLAVTESEREALGEAVQSCEITHLPTGAPQW